MTSERTHLVERRFSHSKLRQLDVWLGDKTCDIRYATAEVEGDSIANFREHWKYDLPYVKVADVMRNWHAKCKQEGLTGLVRQKNDEVLESEEASSC